MKFRRREIKDLARLILSGVLLVFSMFLIGGVNEPEARKWAFGMIGLIVGHWLK
jgi:hypothetical protein